MTQITMLLTLALLLVANRYKFDPVKILQLLIQLLILIRTI